MNRGRNGHPSPIVEMQIVTCLFKGTSHSDRAKEHPCLFVKSRWERVAINGIAEGGHINYHSIEQNTLFYSCLILFTSDIIHPL